MQARVHQRAPAALVDRESPARPVGVVADPRAQAEPADLRRDHVPDHPLGDELAQLARRGVPEVVVVHGELHARQLSGRDHRVAIGEVERERLLAQHVDAARRCRLDDLAMRGGRRADADHVDVVTREQVAIVRVASRRLEPEEIADEVRAPGRGIGDGDNLHAVRAGHRGCVASLDDPAATNQSEAHSIPEIEWTFVHDHALWFTPKVPRLPRRREAQPALRRRAAGFPRRLRRGRDPTRPRRRSGGTPTGRTRARRHAGPDSRGPRPSRG